MLDLADARPGDRLRRRPGARRAGGRIAAVTGDGRHRPVAGQPSAAGTEPADGPKPRPRRRRRRARAGTDRRPTTADAGLEAGRQARTPAAERRRAAEALIGLWTDVARDLALCQRGLDRSVRDLGLLDDTRAIAARLDPATVAHVPRPARSSASVLLAGNVSPELVLDDLALAWPRPTSPRAA